MKPKVALAGWFVETETAYCGKRGIVGGTVYTVYTSKKGDSYAGLA